MAGAKYHVASNTPYTRYFPGAHSGVSVLPARCVVSQDKQKGRCTSARLRIGKEAGAKFNKMPPWGKAKPWPDALEALPARADGRRCAAGVFRSFSEGVAGRPEQGKESGLVGCRPVAETTRAPTSVKSGRVRQVGPPDPLMQSSDAANVRTSKPEPRSADSLPAFFRQRHHALCPEQHVAGQRIAFRVLNFDAGCRADFSNSTFTATGQVYQNSLLIQHAHQRPSDAETTCPVPAHTATERTNLDSLRRQPSRIWKSNLVRPISASDEKCS